MTQRRSISSDVITRAYMDSLLVEVRHLDSVIPDMSFSLWGKTFRGPVTTAALSHLYNTRENGMVLMAEGAKNAGLICFSGMGSRKEVEAMCATGAEVVKIVKPYADRQLVRDKLIHAVKQGCFAVGIDIDHAFERQNGYDCIEGREMRPITTDELRDLVRSVEVPFVIKGVLSLQDAEKCLSAGVKGMVISHHNGRLDTAVPPAMILPQIRKLCGKDIALFVDCSLQSGQDVYKCLALGADACCIGRPIMQPLKEKGAAGVQESLEGILRDLSYTMSMTCAKDLASIDPSSVHKSDFMWL